MIRRLCAKDNEQILKFLEKEKEFNLFIIGDIENHGYDKDFMSVYGEYDGEDIVSCVLFYRDSVVYYTIKNESSKEVIDLINAFDYKVINGKEEVIDQIKEFVDYYKCRDDYFVKISELKVDSETDYTVKKAASVDELTRIFEMLSTIDEFRYKDADDYMFNQFISSNMYKLEADTTDSVYYIENKDGSIITTASTAASNTYSTMIVGVATNKVERGKGLATKIIYEISKEYLGKGKTLCLFYDNPKAGSIYRRVGFEDVGKWTMLNR